MQGHLSCSPFSILITHNISLSIKCHLQCRQSLSQSTISHFTLSTVTQLIDLITIQPINILNNSHMSTVTQSIDHNTFHNVEGHLANRFNHNSYIFTVTQLINILNNSHMSMVTQPIDIINNSHMVMVTQPINHNTFHTVDGHLTNRYVHHTSHPLSFTNITSYIPIEPTQVQNIYSLTTTISIPSHFMFTTFKHIPYNNFINLDFITNTSTLH